MIGTPPATESAAPFSGLPHPHTGLTTQGWHTHRSLGSHTHIRVWQPRVGTPTMRGWRASVVTGGWPTSRLGGGSRSFGVETSLACSSRWPGSASRRWIGACSVVEARMQAPHGTFPVRRLGPRPILCDPHATPQFVDQADAHRVLEHLRCGNVEGQIGPRCTLVGVLTAGTSRWPKTPLQF